MGLVLRAPASSLAFVLAGQSSSRSGVHSWLDNVSLLNEACQEAAAQCLGAPRGMSCLLVALPCYTSPYISARAALEPCQSRVQGFNRAAGSLRGQVRAGRLGVGLVPTGLVTIGLLARGALCPSSGGCSAVLLAPKAQGSVLPAAVPG